MDRRKWQDKYRAMRHDEFETVLGAWRDVDNQLYGMLGEAAARLNQLRHHRDQLYSFFNQTAECLGVIPEQPYILEEIEKLKACGNALVLIREYVQGCNAETGAVDIAWVIDTINAAFERR